VVEDQQVPLTAQPLGEPLQLGLVRHRVGLGVIGRTEQFRADLPDDLASRPRPVFIAEPEGVLHQAGALPRPGQVCQQSRLPGARHTLDEQFVTV
jgi:hypothetical protein